MNAFRNVLAFTYHEYEQQKVGVEAINKAVLVIIAEFV